MKTKLKNGLLVIIVGLIFVGAGVFLIIRTNNKLKGLDGVTKATEINENCQEEMDTDGNKTICHPIYTYEVDGVTYQCKSNDAGASSVNTKKNKVFYDTKNPDKCMTEFEKSTGWFLYIIIAVGVLVVGLGIVNIIKPGNEQ